MARPAIVEKLERHLRQEMTTESSVVYFLVGVRKLLEHDKSKAQFQVLNFYCNWAVHTKLDSSPIADEIIRLMDDLQAYMVSASETPVSTDDLQALLDQSSLRMEIATFFKHVGLPDAVCGSNAYWNKFQRLLGAVIEDTPLLIHKAKKQTTRYVESISVKNLPLEGGKSFSLEWKPKFHTKPQGKLRLHPGLALRQNQG
jgi:hypothetical protein